MFAFLLICLLPAALIAAIVPVVVFGLMLETAAHRASQATSSPRPVRVAKPAHIHPAALHSVQWS